MKTLFFSLFFVSVVANANKSSPTTITWIRWDDPPIFILSGPYVGQGLLDNAQNLISKKLSKYQHQVIDGSVPRVIKEAERKSQTCNAGWLDTPEWRKIFYFSRPIFLAPTNGILLKKSHAKTVANLNPYSLQKFLDKKTDWKLGVGRLYGEGIDDILVKNNYQKNPQIITVSSSLKAHQMLRRDRIQYTLGYPAEAVYYNELLDSQDEVEYLPLSDNTTFVNVVVACPKTPWGKKIVAEIDQVLKDPQILEDINKGLERWLSPHDRQMLAERKKALRQK